MNPHDPQNKAYWLPVPIEYLTAVGAVTAQWGYFEMQFDGLIKILCRHPDAVKLASKIPPAFGDRPKRMRQLARVALAKSPTLVEKICDFASRADDAYTKRNVIVHGFWFDMAFAKPELGVIIMTRADGKGDFYSVTASEIEALAEKIGNLKLEGIMLMFPSTGNNEPFLTPDEVCALQEYHTDFPGSAQETPIPRDPARKGTPQQPEPFRA